MVTARAALLLLCLSLVGAAPAASVDDEVSPRDNGMILRYRLCGCGSKGGQVPSYCWDCKCGYVGNMKCAKEGEAKECMTKGCGCCQG